MRSKCAPLEDGGGDEEELADDSAQEGVAQIRHWQAMRKRDTLLPSC
jgi:hypothetical protein